MDAYNYVKESMSRITIKCSRNPKFLYAYYLSTLYPFLSHVSETYIRVCICFDCPGHHCSIAAVPSLPRRSSCLHPPPWLWTTGEPDLVVHGNTLWTRYVISTCTCSILGPCATCSLSLSLSLSLSFWPLKGSITSSDENFHSLPHCPQVRYCQLDRGEVILITMIIQGSPLAKEWWHRQCVYCTTHFLFVWGIWYLSETLIYLS